MERNTRTRASNYLPKWDFNEISSEANQTEKSREGGKRLLS